MKGVNLQSVSMPAPTDGLNLVAAPNQLKPTEARELTNFVVNDAGVTTWGAIDVLTYGGYTGAGAGGRGLVAYQDYSGNEYLIYAVNDGGWKVWRFLEGADTFTNISSGGAIDAGCRFPVLYAQKIFWFSGTAAVARYGIGDPAIVAAGFTLGGGPDTNLITATTYKGRIYCVQQNSTDYWYSPVGAITGALTNVGLGGVFKIPGQIAAISNWTFNPGNLNDEYLVILNQTGEVLIYSGLDPTAATWGLVARGFLPKIDQRQPFIAVGSELYVITSRGVVALSELFSGRQSIQYNTISRRIKNQVSSVIGGVFYPKAAYLAVADLAGFGIYVQNTERGAWSYALPRNKTGALTSAFNYINATSNYIYAINNIGQLCRFNNGISSSERCIWKTNFNDFGIKEEKTVKFVKLQGLGEKAP